MPAIERVMFINPPARESSFHDFVVTQPVGLGYLASVTRRNYQVKILDAVALGREKERWIKWNYIEAGLTIDEIVEEVKKFNPQVVGISCLFSSHFLLVAGLAAAIKKQLKDIIIVTGGAHPSFMPEDSFRRAPELDYIVIGEAEESFPHLLQALATGSGLDAIDGLAWKDNGGVRINPKTRWIENLDSLPFPAWDLLPMERYFEINVPFMFYSKSPRNVSFITSRGCPFKCSFCSSCNYWGNRIRYRSIENIIAEMKKLKTEFKIEELKFEDDNLLLNRERAKRLFRAMIEEKLNFHWNMPNGAYVMSFLDEELVRLMKESGCYEVVLAFESGDQNVLDNIIHKPEDLSKAERVVKLLRDYHIGIHAFFIVGLPGETWEQIKNTFSFPRRLKIDMPYFLLFNPLPGSELYDTCIKKGYYDPELVYYTNYCSNSITTDEFNPAQLRRLQYFYTLYRNVDLLARNPKLVFTKYLRRVATRKNYRAIPRSIRTAFLSLLKND